MQEPLKNHNRHASNTSTSLVNDNTRNLVKRYVKLVYAFFFFKCIVAKVSWNIQILLAPNFMGPPTPLLALLASSSFCLMSFRSSRFLRASSNLLEEALGFSSSGSNSVSFQLLLVFRLCNAEVCSSPLILSCDACCGNCSEGPSLGTQGSDGEANSASAS